MPQPSAQSLQFSGIQPIQPFPNIGNVVGKSQNIVNSQPVPAQQPPQTTIQPQSVSTEEPPQSADNQNDTIQENQNDQIAPFEECWLKLVENIFAKRPAFYHQLKTYIPKLDNGIIKLEVENEFQKKQIDAHRRAMIDFWNSNFPNKISDVELVIQEHEGPKVIYTNEDKVENMIEQNPALKDFLQVLNFRIKE